MQDDRARALVRELAEGDLPDPLARPRTFALTRGDLARLAGEVPPAEAQVADDGPPPPPVPPPVPGAVHRGSYADHRRQFPEACADAPTRPARESTPPARGSARGSPAVL